MVTTATYLIQSLAIPHTQPYLTQAIAGMTFNSLSEFSGLLDTYQVANIAVRLQPEQLTGVSLPCLVHCQDTTGEAYFAVVTSLKNEQVTFFDGTTAQQIPVGEFAALWPGSVLLLAPDARSGEPNYAQNRRSQWVQTLQQGVAYGGLGLCAIGLLSRATGWPEAIWLLLQFLGLAICVLLLVNEYGKPGPLISKLCQVRKQTNCQAVLQSSAAKLFGWLSLAELGFMFFLDGIAGFSVPTSLLAKGLVVGAVLPFSFWSVYYLTLDSIKTLTQFRKKRWGCEFC